MTSTFRLLLKFLQQSEVSTQKKKKIKGRVVLNSKVTGFKVCKDYIHKPMQS